MSKRDLWGDRHPDCPERQQLRPDQDFTNEEDNNFGSQSQLLGSGGAGGKGIKSGGGLAPTTATSGAQGPIINLRLEPLASASLSLGRGLTPAGSEQYLGGSSAALTATAALSAGGLGNTSGAISAASLAANTSTSIPTIYSYLMYWALYIYFYFSHRWTEHNAVVQLSSRWGCWNSTE